jgi:hypothetical protein
MAIGNVLRRGLPGVVLRWASGLRFPVMFAFTALLFGLNLLVPDVIPLADEILMGLVALLFGSMRKKKGNEKEASQHSPGDIEESS